MLGLCTWWEIKVRELVVRSLGMLETTQTNCLCARKCTKSMWTVRKLLHALGDLHLAVNWTRVDKCFALIAAQNDCTLPLDVSYILHLSRMADSKGIYNHPFLIILCMDASVIPLRGQHFCCWLMASDIHFIVLYRYYSCCYRWPEETIFFVLWIIVLVLWKYFSRMEHFVSLNGQYSCCCK